MKTSRLVRVNMLCCCLLKLTVLLASGAPKTTSSNSSYTKQSERHQRMGIGQSMMNFGLNLGDLEKSGEYAQLSEKMPHFVPDFMRLMFEKHRFELHNLSLKIEGKRKYLGPIEMIQSHRLREIHTWPKQGVHKLIFKESSEPVDPILRELRLNRKLFPKNENKNKRGIPRQLTILSIFNSRLQMVKNTVIRDGDFTNGGWISIEILENVNDSVFFVKFFRVLRISKGNFKKIDFKSYPLPIKESYPYYANIISFYRRKRKTTSAEVRSQSFTEDERTIRRGKRDLSHNGDCQRHPLMVTFKEVGWSKWIIAPQNYNAYYCKGNCPYPLSDNFNATNHAIIQLLVHGLKDVSVPKPCCVPYQLTPETLLYLNNEGDALLREFKDMSVSSCSCR